jgi:hypothetical protein
MKTGTQYLYPISILKSVYIKTLESLLAVAPSSVIDDDRSSFINVETEPGVSTIPGL